MIIFLLSPFLNTVCVFIFLPSETKRLNGPVSVIGLLLVLVLYTTVYSKIKVVVKIITVIIVKSWQSLSI